MNASTKSVEHFALVDTSMLGALALKALSALEQYGAPISKKELMLLLELGDQKSIDRFGHVMSQLCRADPPLVRRLPTNDRANPVYTLVRRPPRGEFICVLPTLRKKAAKPAAKTYSAAAQTETAAAPAVVAPAAAQTETAAAPDASSQPDSKRRQLLEFVLGLEEEEFAMLKKIVAVVEATK